MTDWTSWVQKSPVEGREDEMRGKGGKPGKVGRENMEAENGFSTISTLFSPPPKP